MNETMVFVFRNRRKMEIELYDFNHTYSDAIQMDLKGITACIIIYFFTLSGRVVRPLFFIVRVRNVFHELYLPLCSLECLIVYFLSELFI